LSFTVNVSIEDILAEIAKEPELPGRMPDKMWHMMRDSRECCEQGLRTLIHVTKENISARIIGLLNEKRRNTH